jgi:hypothetical protein
MHRDIDLSWLWDLGQRSAEANRVGLESALTWAPDVVRAVADDAAPAAVSQGQSNDTKSLQGAFDDVFMQYQVDFTTYGHIHTYARCA